MTAQALSANDHVDFVDLVHGSGFGYFWGSGFLWPAGHVDPVYGLGFIHPIM